MEAASDRPQRAVVSGRRAAVHEIRFVVVIVVIISPVAVVGSAPSCRHDAHTYAAAGLGFRIGFGLSVR